MDRPQAERRGEVEGHLWISCCLATPAPDSVRFMVSVDTRDAVFQEDRAEWLAGDVAAAPVRNRPVWNGGAISVRMGLRFLSSTISESARGLWKLRFDVMFG
ncbi:MAG: hypothetical protein ABL982_15395 [Vicinamibacterales bacterium]